jgi:hypothetical protein
LKVTAAFVTLDMRWTPDLDRVKPMRSKQRARVVNRHDGNELTAKRPDMLGDFESAGKRWGYGFRHARQCAPIGATSSS